MAKVTLVVDTSPVNWTGLAAVLTTCSCAWRAIDAWKAVRVAEIEACERVAAIELEARYLQRQLEHTEEITRLDNGRPSEPTNAIPSNPGDLTNPLAVRLACRNTTHAGPTPHLAPGHLQANLLVLPARHAQDFRDLCARNPVPCPLLAWSAAPGRWEGFESCVPGLSGEELLGPDVDVRTDLPRYNVYRAGRLVKDGVTDVLAEWTAAGHEDGDKHVAFLIGCSFSFDTALLAAGLAPRHMLHGGNVPMYRTAIPLCPAGVFEGGCYVVSMRPYPAKEIERVRAITRPFGATHGEPIAWGWDAIKRLGIKDIDRPDWGDAASSVEGGRLGAQWGSEDEVPVFWGCGVTPQAAVMEAGERIQGTVIAHAPGHMLVLDARDEDVRTLA